MCLAVPMKVVEINDNTAKVEVGGTQRTIGLDIIDPKPNIGEYVIVHAGFALHKIDEQTAMESLLILKQAAELTEQ